ncbi:hypothetical protein [Corticimicrobacter populi]|uniref:Uncharacterized protein n=1 Tax=Corticimicrobacter populi TaxID=2175229 RepID=A0A2V1K289_9BURK|nr:hypothetical protein [Corticimicrobacter populi]PWF25364.1 hypothetical protein DD235_04270 [Corticimicrobacter populi]
MSAHIKSYVGALAAGLGLLLPALAHAQQQQDYRLAYSKAEDIELFVEGAGQDTWCMPQLKLRAMHGAHSGQENLARLMPKLGALLAQQCPQAQRADWRSLDPAGKLIANGHSLASSGWQLVAAAPAPQQQAVASSEPANTQSDGSVAVTTSESGSEAGSSDAVSTTGTVQDQAPVTAAESITAAPAADASPAPATTPEPAPVAAQPVTEVAVEPPVTETPPAEVVASTSSSQPSGLAAFAVGGWQPPTGAQQQALHATLDTMQDQNGCKIVSRFNLGDQAAYMTLQSEGLTCGADGFAQGKGRLRIERTDGALIARTGDIWFSHGIPFSRSVERLSVADIAAVDAEKQRLWFGLGSDRATDSHYFLRTQLGYERQIGIWQVDPRIDVLTGNTAVFRQADQIRLAMDKALGMLQAQAMPDAYQASVMFTDQPESGLFVGSDYGAQEHQLYQLSASRRHNWRTGQGQGAWQYDLRQANNLLFRREARQAEEQRREEQQRAQELRVEQYRQASLERERLAQYDALESLSSEGPAALRKHVERDISYRPDAAGSYSRLLQGGEQPLVRIVRVDDSDGKDAVVDWPYPMRLSGLEALEEGWYWVSGTQRLDTARRDDDGLPMTIVTVAEGLAMPCKEAGCADLVNPLAIARIQFGQPDWTPEAARQLVENAPKSLW